MDERESNAMVCVFESMAVASIIMVVYAILAFENIPGMDYMSSMKVFVLGCIITSLYLMVINMFKKGLMRKIFNITLPLGIYTVITYFKAEWKDFAVLAIIALAAISFYGFLIFSQKIKNQARRKRIIRKRILKFLGGSGYVVNLLMMIIVVGMCGRVMMTGFTVPGPAESIRSIDETKGCTVISQMDKLCYLTNGEWQTLSIREKLDVLQSIVNIEASKLGFEPNIRIGAGSQKEDVLGNYNSEKKIITVDRDYLDEAEPGNIIRTVTHECRHAYQNRLVEAYDAADEAYKNLEVFENAKKFKEGFARYGRIPYYTNPVEVDARYYSDEVTEEYLKQIKSLDEKMN